MTTAPPTASPVGRPQPGSPWRLSARTVVLLVAGTSALLLAALVAALPVPYVVFSPGPVRDTLGQAEDGESLIVIDGTETFPTEGRLDLTTIRVAGGPLGRVTVLDAVQAYVDSSRSLRPVETVYPPEETREEAREASTAQMTAAQQSAAVSAIKALGEEVPSRLVVRGFAGNPAAEAALAEQDVVTELDGQPLDSSSGLVEQLQDYAPGDVVDVTVERDGQTVTEPVELAESDEGAVILGVLISPDYELPFEVSYDVGGIGGPSAGLMFSLGIYDKLTPGPLTGGEHVAGTGTIDDEGLVGPIDGIQQKMVGARDVGAAWFLAPADNCGDVVGAVPADLQVTAVASLDEALQALAAIGADEGTQDLPTCEDVLAAR
ncbi:PDZ domain-containing protein [Jannaschia sp. R86511]|uniref:YlbL family protein n=1 Tax=Jannaschia sp. R86511 TaxID=3093853 RepID=UPI0036D3DAD2